MDTGTTLLLGLGNPVRGDDAVGLRVAEAVGQLMRADPVPGVLVATSTRGGMELIDLLSGHGRAVIVDCMEAPDAVPGSVRQLSPDDVKGCARLVGSHDIGVAEAIEMGRLLGADMPSEVEIIGIACADTACIEEQLSPALAAAVEPTARWLFRKLSTVRGARLLASDGLR